MWIHIRGILGLGCALAADKWVSVMWPDATLSASVWLALMIVLGTTIMIGNYWRFVREGFFAFGRWLREGEISFTWRGLAWGGWAVVLLLIAFMAWNPIVRFIERQEKAMQASHDRIRTRPICGSDCANFDWIVEVCKREAVKIGALTGLPLHSDTERATRHFRGCLIDKGMNWERCKKGEAECVRFWHIGLRVRGWNLPSFVE